MTFFMFVARWHFTDFYFLPEALFGVVHLREPITIVFQFGGKTCFEDVPEWLGILEV